MLVDFQIFPNHDDCLLLSFTLLGVPAVTGNNAQNGWISYAF